MATGNEILKLNRAAIDEQVAEQLLRHLTAEIEALTAMLNAVRNVHTALRDLDDDALYESLDVEARELAASAAIQERRHRLQNDLARLLSLQPHEVTIRRLVDLTTGTVRQSIEAAWTQLSLMASEIERLNRQNAAMIEQSLSIARGVLSRLTGGGAVNESYTAVGGRAETRTGPVIQWGA